MNKYLPLILFFAVSVSSRAADKIFIGTDGNWHNASNWSPLGVPGTSDVAFINENKSVVLSSDANVGAININETNARLTVNSGITLTLSGSTFIVYGENYKLVIGSDAELINNGTINFSPTVDLYGLIRVNASGNLINNISGSITYHGPASRVISWAIAIDSGTFTNSGLIDINSDQSMIMIRQGGEGTNHTTGTITGSSFFLLDFDNAVFHNFGLIQKAGSGQGNSSIPEGSILNNYSCARLITGVLYISGVISNSGYIEVSIASYGAGSITNNGVFISAGNPNITNNKLRVNHSIPIFDYGPSNDFTIDGIYTDASTLISAGVFTAPNTFAPSGLSSGVQTLYAKITASGGGCSFTVPFSYDYDPPAPVITEHPEDRNICAGSSTTFRVTAAGEVSFQWQVDEGGGFRDLTDDSPYSDVTSSILQVANAAEGMYGYSYRCVVTGEGGKQTISEPARLRVSVMRVAGSSSTDESCTGAADGSATLIAIEGTLPYSYSWEHTSATTATVTGLSPGTYTGTLSDRFGCRIQKVFFISTTALMPGSPDDADVSSAAVCEGNQVNLTATCSSATVKWYDAASGGNLLGTGETLSVTVLHDFTAYAACSNGNCESGRVQAGSVSVKAPPTAGATPTSTTICSGTATDIALTSIPDGAGFTWTASLVSGAVSGASDGSGASITQILTGAGLIHYSVTPTYDGCTGSAITVAVTVDLSPEVVLGTAVNPTTCSGANGSIPFTTNLPAGSYTLNYSKGGSPLTAPITVASGAFTLSGLSAGVYSDFSVTVNGCTGNAAGSATLSDPVSSTLSLGTAENPTTCSGTDGSILFTTNLPAGSYTLNYSKGGSPLTAPITVASGAFALSGLSAGVYSDFSVMVSGCTGNAAGSATLSDPVSPTLSLGTAENPTTCSGMNGSILFTTSLAAGSYTLNYTKGGSPLTAPIMVASGAFTLSGLSAGVYSGFLVRVNGCTGNAAGSATLSDPVSPTLSLGTAENPTTCSGTDGSIPFTTNLPAGSYTLNYTKSGSPLSAPITVASGEFVLSVPAGVYSDFSITVNGCMGNAAGLVILTDPISPTLTLFTTANPSVCDGMDGSISFITNLPAGSYTLNYTRGGSPLAAPIAATSGAFILSGLSAGVYSDFSITVSGCTKNAFGSVTLTAPSSPTLSLGTAVNPTTCSGTDGSIPFTTNLPDGSYTLNYSKGGSPLTVPITVASGAFSLSGLSAGVYSGFSVTVSGCTGNAAGSATLSDPSSPTLSLGTAVNPTTCSGTDGSIPFTTNLPDGSYTMNYSKGGSPLTAPITVASGAFTLSGLSAGVYSGFSVTVSGCTGNAAGSATLSDPSSPTLSLGTAVNPSVCGGTDGSIPFTTNLSAGSYTLNYSKGGSPLSAPITVASGAFSLSGLSAGVYSGFSVTVSGCTGNAAGSATLSDPSSPTLSLGTAVSPTTCSGTDGKISFTTSLPAGSHTLNYSKGGSPLTAPITVASGAFTLSGLSAGVYSDFSVMVSGCTGNAAGSATLSDPVSPTLTFGTAVHPSVCAGTDGSIPFTTNLPDGSYTMNYSKGGSPLTAPITLASGAFTLSGLSAGVYSDFSATVSGCTGNAAGSATLSDPASPTLTLGTVVDPALCGGTGSIHFITTGLSAATHTLTFKKGNKDTTANISVSGNAFTLSGLSAGAYSAFRISTSGCQFNLADTLNLVNQAAPVATITPSGPTGLCEGEQVTLTVTEAATYLWSTGDTTRSITVDEAGLYSVTITSAQGCTSQSQITVTQKICNVPPMAVCKPHVVLVAQDNCYATLRPEDLDAGSYDKNNDWFNRSIDINPDLTVGSYSVTSTVVDIRGAANSCQSRVDVVDHTPPVALARGLTLALDQNGNASVSAADVDAGSGDNCGAVSLSLNRTHFDCSDLGHHQVILTVTDASGNTATALAGITVVDNIPPVVITKAMTLTLDHTGNASLTAEQLTEHISDNCGIWDVRLSQSHFSCEHIGINKVVLTVQDVHGGTFTDTVSVTVTDTIAPVIVAQEVTLYLDETGKAHLNNILLGLNVTDNCAVHSVQLSRTDFGCEDLGEHVIHITATDVYGNTSDTTVTVIVADTLAPVVKTRDVILFLNASGAANLTAEQADDGSTDNCGILRRELSRSSFGCSDTGQHTVTFTLTDASGNRASATLLVTVRDTVQPVARTQNVILELSDAGTASLTAEEVDNASSDNCGIASMALSQTLFSCEDLGSRLITLTVTDMNGNMATEKAEVLIRDPEGICPCSYGVLATEKITLRSNEIFAGGIGVTSANGKVKLRNTVVNQAGTFVKAPQTRFDSESESSIYFRGSAPQPESFRKNGNKDKGKEKISKGESKTLAAGRYGKIKVKKDASLSFSGGEVYIRSLKVKKKAKININDPVVLLVRDQVRLASSVEFNPGGESVRLYAGKRIFIGNGSEVTGYLHTQGLLKTPGGSDETRLEGFFAAERIKAGRNTQWSGGGVLCRENEQQQNTAKAKRNMIAKEENQQAPEAEPEIRISLSPNPASDMAQVEIFLPSGKGELILTDLLGNVRIRKGIISAESRHHLDIRAFRPGTYIIRVTGGEQVKTMRLVKENF